LCYYKRVINGKDNMNINVTYQSGPLEAVAYYWTNKLNNRREIVLEFKCPHENVTIDAADGEFATGVYCEDCQNKDMSDNDREGIIGY
jgi:hypothetical protein